MCKVIKYRFTCWHELNHRTSRCGGSFSKHRRGVKHAACVAEPYLVVNLPMKCGPCQHKDWEFQWEAKLSRAQTFLNSLTRKADIEFVSDLCSQLKRDYDEKAWLVRTQFPPMVKESVRRVLPKTRIRSSSKLARELSTEDEDDDAAANGCNGPDDENEAFNLDPTTYENIAWTLEPPEWLNEWYPDDSTEERFGFDSAAESGSSDQLYDNAESDANTCHTPPDLTHSDDTFDTPPESASESHSDADTGSPTRFSAEQLTKDFWQAVNSPPSTPESPPDQTQTAHTPDTLSSQLSDLSLTSNVPNTTNGVAHAPFSVPEPHSSRFYKYELMRQNVAPLKQTNPKLYHAYWLEIHRQQLRELERLL
ncbi:hypothetical protein M011DRAFT_119049 [Sporormia fimetaria CBS 119925]|uniref:Uncharacterized protein n=1 Tax=Sporormia fimetaria CBS 119925 TaxID=1340428 RepID=A0A6A6VP87_9PLEO|nr:hypothetical protein M011DRAFT_119049 [Sporormia fimetaria CBS 119925]